MQMLEAIESQQPEALQAALAQLKMAGTSRSGAGARAEASEAGVAEGEGAELLQAAAQQHLAGLRGRELIALAQTRQAAGDDEGDLFGAVVHGLQLGLDPGVMEAGVVEFRRGVLRSILFDGITQVDFGLMAGALHGLVAHGEAKTQKLLTAEKLLEEHVTQSIDGQFVRDRTRRASGGKFGSPAWVENPQFKLVVTPIEPKPFQISVSVVETGAPHSRLPCRLGIHVLRNPEGSEATELDQHRYTVVAGSDYRHSFAETKFTVDVTQELASNVSAAEEITYFIVPSTDIPMYGEFAITMASEKQDLGTPDVTLQAISTMANSISDVLRDGKYHMLAGFLKASSGLRLRGPIFEEAQRILLQQGAQELLEEALLTKDVAKISEALGLAHVCALEQVAGGAGLMRRAFDAIRLLNAMNAVRQAEAAGILEGFESAIFQAVETGHPLDALRPHIEEAMKRRCDIQMSSALVSQDLGELHIAVASAHNLQILERARGKASQHLRSKILAAERGEFSRARGSSGGPYGSPSWTLNPQWRVAVGWREPVTVSLTLTPASKRDAFAMTQHGYALHVILPHGATPDGADGLEASLAHRLVASTPYSFRPACLTVTLEPGAGPYLVVASGATSRLEAEFKLGVLGSGDVTVAPVATALMRLAAALEAPASSGVAALRAALRQAEAAGLQAHALVARAADALKARGIQQRVDALVAKTAKKAGGGPGGLDGDRAEEEGEDGAGGPEAVHALLLEGRLADLPVPDAADPRRPQWVQVAVGRLHAVLRQEMGRRDRDVGRLGCCVNTARCLGRQLPDDTRRMAESVRDLLDDDYKRLSVTGELAAPGPGERWGELAWRRAPLQYQLLVQSTTPEAVHISLSEGSVEPSGADDDDEGDGPGFGPSFTPLGLAVVRNALGGAGTDLLRQVLPGFHVEGVANLDGADSWAALEVRLDPALGPFYVVPFLTRGHAAASALPFTLTVRCRKNLRLTRTTFERPSAALAGAWAADARQGPRWGASCLPGGDAFRYVRRAWFNNPQIKVYAAEPCRVLVVLRVRAHGEDGAEEAADDDGAGCALHLVAHERTVAFDAHRGVLPARYQRVVASREAYGEACSELCLEADLDPSEFPYFLVPSRGAVTCSHAFALEVFCDKRESVTVTAGASAIGGGDFGRYLRL